MPLANRFLCVDSAIKMVEDARKGEVFTLKRVEDDLDESELVQVI